MRKLLLLLLIPALVLGQTNTVTVNPTTKVTQPPVGKLTLDGLANFFITRGPGSPEETVVSSPGSLYLDTTGALWVKASGTSDTGWNMLSSFVSTESKLLSGGGVAWTGTGFNFIISAATYLINGVQYNSPETNVTLDPADLSDDRIDVFAVDDTGAAVVITGTPGGPPLEPQIDPATQLRLTSVIVPAGSTEPVITTESIYLENTEWTSSTNAATINLASTNNPFAGTKDIEGTTTVSGNLFTLVKPSGTLVPTDFASLILQIRSKAGWPNQKGLAISWLNGATNIGTSVALKHNTFGFDSSNITSYQQIVIPVSLFNTGTGSIDRLRVAVSGGGASIGWYIDNIILQTGTGGGGGGGGDFSTNTNVSVADEIVLFADTTGKLGKRSTGTGIAKLTSGVLSIATEGTDYLGPLRIDDTAYDATTWNGDTTHAPSKNAVRDKIESLAGTIPTISDTVFGSSWNGVTTIAPSKNAVYDELHLFDTDDDGKVDVLDIVTSAGFLAVTSGGVPVEGRTLTEGLAIDITNPTGAAGAPTFAFDPTELTGSRTWGDASTDTIVWTFDRATGTDSTITSLSGGIGVQSLTDAALTSGRVTFAGTAGILTDDSDFTFLTDTLTVTNAKVTTPTNTTTSVVTTDGSQTLTNKRINPRVTTISSNATWSPNADTDDIYEITAQAVDATTISNPSGTPVNGQKLIIKVTGTAARALTWSGSQWRAGDIALPTTTTTTKTMYLGFIYNSTGPKWDLLAKVDNF